MFRAHRAVAGVLLACFAGWTALCCAAGDPASNSGLPERPFIALLLPLAAPEFAPAAEAVVAGCSAALTSGSEPYVMQVHRTDASPAGIQAAYRSAVERGASAIVGPLTRDAVSALARNVLLGPPTLALNVPDADTPIPDRFYVFGLSADAEARVVARNAFGDGGRTALIVHTGSALSRRVAQAFASEWTALGVEPADMVSGSPQFVREQAAKSKADVVFLAADAAEAHQLRPYLGNRVPVYATSLLNAGGETTVSRLDLNGIRFVDMPWLVQPDHPAVMVYPRNERLELGLQRFYALGIDACRVAPLLAERQRVIALDGVTGHLRLRGAFVEREPMPAAFRDGVVAALQPDAPR